LYRAVDATRERPLSPGGDFAAWLANDRFLSGPAADLKSATDGLGSFSLIVADVSRSANGDATHEEWTVQSGAG